MDLAWWLRLVISALGGERQGDCHEFKVNLVQREPATDKCELGMAASPCHPSMSAGQFEALMG